MSQHDDITTAPGTGPVDRPVRPDPVGWVVMWPAAGGGRKPIYSHGGTRPSYGKELDALLNQFPVYATPADAAAPAERDRQSDTPPCALTWAIQRLNSTPYAMTKDECVEMLRGLRSEIQALVGPN